MAAVPSKTIAAGELLTHVSRVAFSGKPLYYGTGPGNRYNDPRAMFGVLYLGFDLPTALMESVFHNHAWGHAGSRTIAEAEIRQRLVLAVGVLDDLVLADLTAQKVMASVYGLNLEQFAGRGYSDTQRISAEIHAEADSLGNPAFDGICYPSRNNYPAGCIALFERADAKIEKLKEVDLDRHIDWPIFVSQYRIVVTP